jgi:hypothetical protein
MMVLLCVYLTLYSQVITYSLTPSRSHNRDSASHLTTVLGTLLAALITSDN